MQPQELTINSRSISFFELLDWAQRQNGFDTAFRNNETFARYYNDAKVSGTFAVVFCDSSICGVAFGVPDNALRCMFISGILTSRPDAFQVLVRYFLQAYKGWTLTGHRKKKLNAWQFYKNPKRLMRKA